MATLTSRELLTTQDPPVVRVGARWRAVQPTVLSLLGGVLLCELVGRVVHFSFLPPFSVVLVATWRMLWSGEILANLTASLIALLIGYGLAVLFAVPLGLLIGRFRTLEFVFDPYINALLATPSLLYVPIFFGLFGVSRLTQVAVVFVYSSIIIVVMCISGVRSVDPNLVEMARSFGATERQLLVRVLLPGALPMVMAGLRLGMGRAVRGMINGEMLIVLIGLGALLRQYGSRFDAASVFGILLVVIVVALLCTSGIQWLERRVTLWAG